MTHLVTQLEGDLAVLLEKTFINPYPTGFIKVDGVVLPRPYEKFVDAIENFEVRHDDVWICSYPKTGTTWTQEMIWSITVGLDDERSKLPLTQRFPNLELTPLVNLDAFKRDRPDVELPESILDSVSYLAKLPSPRFIKTHLPFNLLPSQLRTGKITPKIVYIVRNPKDTCTSNYHFLKLVGGISGSLEDLCRLFVGDTVLLGPFWNHVLGYWNIRANKNVLFLKYEDMKRDLPSVITLAALFFDKKLSADEISTLTEHLSFENARTNAAMNGEDLVETVQEINQVKNKGNFMRSGKVGQWKTDMSSEDIKRFDDWNRQHVEGTGLYD